MCSHNVSYRYVLQFIWRFFSVLVACFDSFKPLSSIFFVNDFSPIVYPGESFELWLNLNESQLFRDVPNQSEKRFKSCLIQTSWKSIRIKFSIKIIPITYLFELKIRFISTWAQYLSDWIHRLVDPKSFRIDSETDFGMKRIRSDWIPFRKFHQGLF